MLNLRYISTSLAKTIGRGWIGRYNEIIKYEESFNFASIVL